MVHLAARVVVENEAFQKFVHQVHLIRMYVEQLLYVLIVVLHGVLDRGGVLADVLSTSAFLLHLDEVVLELAFIISRKLLLELLLFLLLLYSGAVIVYLQMDVSQNLVDEVLGKLGPIERYVLLGCFVEDAEQVGDTHLSMLAANGLFVIRLGSVPRPGLHDDLFLNSVALFDLVVKMI